MNVSDLIASGQWPEPMERGRVADTAFAAAYNRSSDLQRAWIKTGLAAVYAALGGPLPASRERRDSLGHDLSLTSLDAPLDFVLVLCGRDFLSPARLVAAVVPALCARARDVAAVRVGGAWPRPLLTALELCGLETACRIGSRDLPEVLAALPAKGRGAVMVLGDVSLPARLPAALDVHVARIAGRAGVFVQDDACFDADALAFAHPDMDFFVHGGACPELSAFAAGQGELAQAADCGYDVVYAAPHLLPLALSVAPLALGPGRETFWLWPQLAPHVLRRRRLGAAVAFAVADAAAGND
ncbi:MAG: hypothetical protein ACLGQH_06015 [Acidobacteriota bacterium]